MFITLTWIDLVVVFSATVAATLVFRMISRFFGPNTSLQAPEEKGALPLTNPLSFEFDSNGSLTCNNVEAGDFLTGIDLIAPDWSAFRDALDDRFSDLPVAMTTSTTQISTVFQPRSLADPMELEIERHSCGASVFIRQRVSDLDIDGIALHDVLSALPKLELIKSVSDRAPFPVWQTLADGSVGWSNARYKTLDAQVLRDEALLFNVTPTTESADKPTRVTVKDDAYNRVYWFDVTSQEFDQGYMNFAIDIHAVISAESAQRNFVQTLAKTFAHLATGLAIFDRNRQLVLFNPSLFDITELKPEFLTARPNLFSFFDQLRDNQIMPEPKNYSNWRERIADVISAASEDNFNETWHLPNGLTYRMTGRPHPDGAIAFLFEDISAEISLTRRFRSEAEVTRSALDSMDHAIAIFNPAGFVQQCNAAMEQFVDESAESNLETMSVRDITRLWQSTCKPSPAWGEIRDFVAGHSEREVWTTVLHRKNGDMFNLQVSPLVAGASLITLTPKPIELFSPNPAILINSNGKQSPTVAA
jgi:PAS domain-containing protein